MLAVYVQVAMKKHFFFVYCGSNFDIESINNFELLENATTARLF